MPQATTPIPIHNIDTWEPAADGWHHAADLDGAPPTAHYALVCDGAATWYAGDEGGVYALGAMGAGDELTGLEYGELRAWLAEEEC